MTAYVSERQHQRDLEGRSMICCACGHPATTLDPLLLSAEGNRIHHSHYHDPRNGFYQQPYQAQ